jgi:hypothetical protein
MRIRMRWILEEAWLLAAGARAEAFGAAPSGVLDPDDGGTLRRLALRPPEILLGLVLSLAAAVTAPARHARRRRGEVVLERIDLGDPADRHGGLAVMLRAEGRPLPLWWQPGLARALVTGRIGLVGAPLASAADEVVDPAADRRSLAAERPGLIGSWCRGERADGSSRRLLSEFFMNPGGLADAADAGGFATSRDRGKEVEVP